MGGLQQRLGLGDGQDEGKLPRLLYGRQRGGGIPGAELLRDEEAVQAAHHRDVSGDGGSGIAARIEIGDIVPDLLQTDVI
jgi:hypothetical protein